MPAYTARHLNDEHIAGKNACARQCLSVPLQGAGTDDSGKAPHKEPPEVELQVRA